jgi:hypothetical protein
MSPINNVTVSDPKAAVRAQMELMQRYLDGSYDPKAKERVISKQLKEVEDLIMSALSTKATLFAFCRVAKQPLPKLVPEIDDHALYEKLKIVLPSFTQDPSGKDIADFIGDYRITSDVIRDFQERTRLLIREGIGLNTVYRFATEEETASLLEADAEATKEQVTVDVPAPRAKKDRKATASRE